MTRAYNFSAGPAVLPLEVLQQAQKELLEWQDGVSALEHSHRSQTFTQLVRTLRDQFREILNVPSNYKILLMEGGGTAQFAAVPLNLLGNKTTADYLATGFWSERAIAEGQLYTEVNIACKHADHRQKMPSPDTWKLNPNAAYVHYADNETINGLEFPFVPQTGNVPLVVDMSSNILSKPININDYALIYAASQKNIAPAGFTLVIIREDLIGHAKPFTPAILDYKRFVEDGFYNTPVTFSLYFAHLTLNWLKQNSGLTAMAEQSRQKSDALYHAIDNSNGFYINRVHPEFRSRMNVPFDIHNPDLHEEFIRLAALKGLINLRGHKSVGGLRASLYNAMPMEGVKALIEFMKYFQKEIK